MKQNHVDKILPFMEETEVMLNLRGHVREEKSLLGYSQFQV